MSAVFRGATLIRVEALIRGRPLFQCGYPKVRRLFEARCLLEEIRYYIIIVKIITIIATFISGSCNGCSSSSTSSSIIILSSSSLLLSVALIIYQCHVLYQPLFLTFLYFLLCYMYLTTFLKGSKQK